MRFLKACFSFVIILFLSFSALAEWTRIIGDIEGIPKRWEQMEKEGIIKYDSAGNVLLADDYSLSFEGDLMKRGPYGKATIEKVLQLIERYNTDPKSPRVRLVLGNHDLNTLSLIQWLPTMILGEATDFNDWLDKKKLPNNMITRLDYWFERNGVNDKMNWFWLELVAEKLGLSPLDEKFKNIYYPDNKPILDKLAEVIPKEKSYQQFLDYVKPGGTLWKLYDRSSVIDLHETGRAPVS